MKSLSYKIISDAHLDLPMDILAAREKGETHVFQTKYLPMLNNGRVNLVGASIFLDDIFSNEMALRRALAQIQALYLEQDESPELFKICIDEKMIEETILSGKIALILTLEGVEPLMGDIRMLRIFYELGVRIIGLTWSRRNAAGEGAVFRQETYSVPSGLSRFGFQVVEEASKLGMCIDVSHLNEVGFRDVMRIPNTKIMASHSNSRHIVNIERNLSDDMIKEIAKRNGIIGINSMNRLITLDDSVDGPTAIANEIDYIGKLVGIEHVCFGFDLCDQLTDENYSKPLGRPVFDTMSYYSNISDIEKQLRKLGYTENEVRGVFGMNYYRFLVS